MVCERVGKKRDPDHQRDGARDRRKRPERRADWRRDDLCSVGKRRGYLLSEGAHRAVYGYSGTWRRDSVGTAAGDETICMEFSEAQPDHQCAVRRGARDGGEGKKRFPDHRRPCIGAGKRCVCASRTGGKSFEPRVSFFDPAGSRNTDLAGRIMSGSWNCRKGGKEGKKDRNSKSA